MPWIGGTSGLCSSGLQALQAAHRRAASLAPPLWPIPPSSSVARIAASSRHLCSCFFARKEAGRGLRTPVNSESTLRSRQPSPSTMASSRKASTGGLSWAQVQVAIMALGEPAAPEQLDILRALLERFVAENEEPKTSPNLQSTAPDRIDALAALLGRKDVARACPDARLLAVNALKILARRQDVRLRCTQHAVDAVVPLLEAGGGANNTAGSQSLSAALASAAANALSNLAYEPANAAMLVQAGAPLRLLRLLGAAGAGGEAHVNAAGALQTLSYVPEGRAALLKAEAPAVVLPCLAAACGLPLKSTSGGGNAAAVGGSASAGLLSAAADSAEARLQQRLVGVLHNLSSSGDGTTATRRQGGIPLAAALLRGCPALAASAAGTLQNMSRDAAARRDIRGLPGAVAGLLDLLTGPNVQAAVCAAGALVNLLADGAGQDLGGLTSALATALAGAAVVHSLGCAAPVVT